MPFIVTTRDELMHSAKGSTWKDHKYIKKVGDKYIYATTKGKIADVSGWGVILPGTKYGSVTRDMSGNVIDSNNTGRVLSKKAYDTTSKKQAEAAKAKEREKNRSNAQAAYAKKVAANNAATNALSNVKPGGKAKDTGAKKSTKNYNKQSDKKTKTAKTINDIVNAAVAAAKKKKKKK